MKTLFKSVDNKHRSYFIETAAVCCSLEDWALPIEKVNPFVSGYHLYTLPALIHYIGPIIYEVEAGTKQICYDDVVVSDTFKLKKKLNWGCHQCINLSKQLIEDSIFFIKKFEFKEDPEFKKIDILIERIRTHQADDELLHELLIFEENILKAQIEIGPQTDLRSKIMSSLFGYSSLSHLVKQIQTPADDSVFFFSNLSLGFDYLILASQTYGDRSTIREGLKKFETILSESN